MCLTTSLRRPANTVNTIYGIDVIFITNHSKLGQNTLFYQQLHVCICEICYKNIYLKCLHCLFFYLFLQIIWILSESKSQFVYLSISTYIFRSRYFSFLNLFQVFKETKDVSIISKLSVIFQLSIQSCILLPGRCSYCYDYNMFWISYCYRLYCQLSSKENFALIKFKIETQEIFEKFIRS